jgi:hypothetical protein
MVILLIHWLIHRGKEGEFEKYWEGLNIAEASGCYREILTKLDTEPPDARFHTFSLGDPFYTTYINIGIWESVERFYDAIAQYMPTVTVDEAAGERTYTIKLREFEFKMRERAALKVIADRGGPLPHARLPYGGG